jgi:iron complex transport system substrate-binding protein
MKPIRAIPEGRGFAAHGKAASRAACGFTVCRRSRRRFWVFLVAFAAGCAPEAPTPTPAKGGLRILSLTPCVTEILFEIGLGDRIVGRTTYCNWPPEAGPIPVVGDTLSLDVEKVVSLAPTVAFVVTRREDRLQRLESLGIRTVPLETDTMAELLETIRVIGRQTGRTPAADALVARIQSDLEAVRAGVRGRPRPRVLFTFPITIGSVQIMVAGRGTFVDELLAAAGAVNAYPDRADWPMVPAEKIVELAPEVIVVHAADLSAGSDRARAIRAAWDRYQSIPAVARGRVHVLGEAFLTIPGPRVGLAARILAGTIHPDLVQEARR